MKGGIKMLGKITQGVDKDLTISNKLFVIKGWKISHMLTNEIVEEIQVLGSEGGEICK